MGLGYNSGRNLDLNKIRFPYLHYILQQSFWIGYESEKVESLYLYLEKTRVTIWDPLTGSQYLNTALNHNKVSIVPCWPLSKKSLRSTSVQVGPIDP